MVCLATMGPEGGCIPLAGWEARGRLSVSGKMPCGLCSCWFISSRLSPTITSYRHTTCAHLYLYKCRKLCPHCCWPLAVFPVRCLLSSGDDPGSVPPPPLLGIALLPGAHFHEHFGDQHLCTRGLLPSLEPGFQHRMLGLMTPVTRSHALWSWGW